MSSLSYNLKSEISPIKLLVPELLTPKLKGVSTAVKLVTALAADFA